jgi:choice-of-anchor B domain-containing protein
MYSHLTVGDLGASYAEDSWGYVSPSGREYAIVGLSTGTGFVEITDPANPVIVAVMTQPNRGRDMKVYQDYVYSSSDSGPTHVYDVSDIDNGVITHVRSFNQGTHNLAVDEVSGFLYLAGGGVMRAYDLSDPSDPTLVGTWPGQTHDTQVVTYIEGPYAGRQIAFVFAGWDGWLDIVDVTDKSSMFRMGQTSYPSPGYTHQGWLTADRQYLYVSDEVDYIARTTIIDVSDLSNPTFIRDITNGLQSTDHNLYVRNGFIFEANYTSGLRIFDASDPINPVEVGYFDTYPANNNPGYDGAWNVYPFFPSGTVIVSDRSGGLFILDPSAAVGGVPGDMNCDGVLDQKDVGPLVQALTDPSAYSASFPGCDITGADMNGDGNNNGLDMKYFVAALLAP